MKTILLASTLTLILTMTACQKSVPDNAIQSPDGNLSFELDTSGAEGITYSLTANGSVLIEPSQIGLSGEGTDLAKGLSFVAASKIEQLAEEYTLISGKRLMHAADFNARLFKFSSPSGIELNMEVRAFNDGIAFRYILVGQSAAPVHIESESTTFNLPQPGKAWMHPYDEVTKYTPGYETYFQGDLTIGAPAPEDKNGWAFPLLFEVNDHWLLISEAGHDGSFPGMHLNVDEGTGTYSMRLPEPDEAYGIHPATAKRQLPWVLPWRVIIAGDSLSTIVESDLVTHVANPNLLTDTSWIKPGRSSWSWWSDNDSPKDYAKLKRFVDFCTDMGWEYSLVDANWDEMVGGDLEKLANYAASRGVGLLVWYNSGGEHNTVTEKPRDRMWDRDIRRAEMKMLNDMGIKGIKVDFFQSDKPAILRQYIDILEDAAEFQLMVNFHGCTLPKGWRRTYPNLLTMESIRGGESYIFAKEFPDKAGVHLNIATYTRNVVGPMDYTPVGISDLKYPHLTSYAFELAQGVVFESGIQHMSDDPDAYLGLPAFAQEYLKELPVVWDETRFIAGYPGKFTVLARRSGNAWYIAGINGLDTAVSEEIDLGFLPEPKGAIEVIASDGSREVLFRKNLILREGNKLMISMGPLDGFVGKVDLK